jgi:hypothetical protein
MGHIKSTEHLHRTEHAQNTGRVITKENLLNQPGTTFSANPLERDEYE